MLSTETTPFPAAGLAGQRRFDSPWPDPVSNSATQILVVVRAEAAIRSQLEGALTGVGYLPVVAADGRQALLALEAEAGRFGGIITDTTLGSDPDGWELGRRARELSPRIPVVYVHGAGEDEWFSKGVPNSAIVSKARAAAQVVTAISSLLIEEVTRGFDRAIV